MADETPPEANNGSDPANSEYERQQKQDDHTGPFGQHGARATLDLQFSAPLRDGSRSSAARAAGEIHRLSSVVHERTRGLQERRLSQ